MMKVSTKGRYALRLMIDLAEHYGNDYVPLKDVSTRQGISMRYLEQIISSLVKARLVFSYRGKTGGYKLASPPSTISAADILKVCEGPISPLACLDKDCTPCPRASSCSSHRFWAGLQSVISDYLSAISLDDLKNTHPNHDASSPCI